MSGGINVLAVPARDRIAMRFPDGYQESFFLMTAHEARELAKALELSALALSMGAQLDVMVEAGAEPC